MRIHLIAVGRRLPAWAEHGYTDYARRLPAQMALCLVEIAPVSRGGGTPAATAVRKEGERIRAAIPSGARVVALDERGRQWTSTELAAHLKLWMGEGRDTTLLIGGADGLDPALRARADSLWSLSKLTLPHTLARVLVAEQVYRAWSLLNNHPYHRA